MLLSATRLIPMSVAIGALTLSACTPAPTYQKIEGQTMGTSYHITFKAPKGVAVTDIQADIDKRLAQINASMSTYDPNSTISKFNALKAHESIVIDDDFIHVLNDSREIYEKSAHAFDPTVYPLVKLWGFGGNTNIERLQNPPRDDEILQAKKIIGLDKVYFKEDDNARIAKSVDGVGLDFSAIAKGYGTDKVAQVLKDTYKIHDFMVEIGGEVATSGVNDKGKAWTLAIDKPIIGSTSSTRDIMTTVSLSGYSMATSGNYRNFMQYDGKTYSHTINPSTAMPVEGSFDSVSVIADTTSLADGWATALSAVSADEALAMAEKNHLKAIFIGKNPQKELEIIHSSAYTNTLNPK